MPEQDEFDPRAISADIARIRATLRRLEEERQQTLQQLEQALHRAQRRLPSEADTDDDAAG